MENESNSLDPKTPFDPAHMPETEPKRGGCLSVYLILMIIGNAFVILLYLAMGDKIARQAKIPGWAPYLLSFFGVLNIIFAYLIYQWKKAGVIGVAASAVL